MYALLGNLSGVVETGIPNIVYARISTIVDHKWTIRVITVKNEVCHNVYNLPVYVVNKKKGWEVFRVCYKT